jgi:NAD(P)H-hydrate repair Nnr-like enzyme with NAD(P)H-hydrate dehydratase domain
LELAMKLARSSNSYIVLKGHRSLVATPMDASLSTPPATRAWRRPGWAMH